MPQRWISGRLIRRWAAWMEGIMTVVRERSRQQRFERSASIWPLIGSAGLAVLIVLDAFRLASRFDQLSVRFVATYAFLLLAQAILLVIIIRKHIRALRALAKQPPSLDSESAPGDIIWHGDDDSVYIVHDKVEYVVAVHPRFVPMLDVRGAAIPTRTPADVSTYGPRVSSPHCCGHPGSSRCHDETPRGTLPSSGGPCSESSSRPMTKHERATSPLSKAGTPPSTRLDLRSSRIVTRG